MSILFCLSLILLSIWLATYEYDRVKAWATNKSDPAPVFILMMTVLILVNWWVY